ncbi:MAG TPA: GFA family protein [Gammaproteobacteria bacterium]|nr:GFA family protein [Gammaproteobacteria bacterium]
MKAAGVEIRCLCGAVRAELAGEPLMQFYCHCDDCQAVSGGAYVALAMFPLAALRVLQGETAPFTLRSLSRERCAACGTQLFVRLPAQGACVVKANLLPAAMRKSEFHMQCRYAVLPVKDGLPHYRGVPVIFGGSDEVMEW